MPTRLVLVRHGESMANAERRIGGILSCAGLSSLGRKQVEALGERLARTAEITAEVLVSSTLPRALETAEVLAPALGHLPIEQDVGVCEHEPGPVADGLTFEEFVARFGRPDWSGDPYLVGFPDGETIADFQHRAARALHAIADRHRDRTIVIACHGGVIDVAFRSFLGLAPTGGFELHTENASLTELVGAGPRWRLVRYNDVGHLEGLRSPPER